MLAPLYSARDALDTHTLCELIATELERDGATDVLSFDGSMLGYANL